MGSRSIAEIFRGLTGGFKAFHGISAGFRSISRVFNGSTDVQGDFSGSQGRSRSVPGGLRSVLWGFIDVPAGLGRFRIIPEVSKGFQ